MTMTRSKAMKAIKERDMALDTELDSCASQFKIRLAYVTAYEDMKELAQSIARAIPEDDHK